ncbi:MAG: hypothetical protein AAGJ74_12655, partial [Pseudomonadota bacterium]
MIRLVALAAALATTGACARLHVETGGMTCGLPIFTPEADRQLAREVMIKHKDDIYLPRGYDEGFGEAFLSGFAFRVLRCGETYLVADMFPISNEEFSNLDDHQQALINKTTRRIE